MIRTKARIRAAATLYVVALTALLMAQGPSYDCVGLLGQMPCPCKEPDGKITLQAVHITSSHENTVAGGPTPAGLSKLPTNRSSLRIDQRLVLPTPTDSEIRNGLDQRFADVLRGSLFQGQDAAAQGQIYEQFHELAQTDVWVWRTPWTIDQQAHGGKWAGNIGRRNVLFGAAIIYASLDCIKSTERDYAGYQRRFRSSYTAVYPKKLSYFTGATNNCPFVGLDVFYRIPGRIGCLGGADFVFEIREHCVRGSLIVDYYSDSKDLYWLAGRDTYYPIRSDRDPNCIIGYLIVTAFGFDIKDCWDSDPDVRTNIHRNLIVWMKRESERRYATGECK